MHTVCIISQLDTLALAGQHLELVQNLNKILQGACHQNFDLSLEKFAHCLKLEELSFQLEKQLLISLAHNRSRVPNNVPLIQTIFSISGGQISPPPRLLRVR